MGADHSDQRKEAGTKYFGTASHGNYIGRALNGPTDAAHNSGATVTKVIYRPTTITKIMGNTINFSLRFHISDDKRKGFVERNSC